LLAEFWVSYSCSQFCARVEVRSDLFAIGPKCMANRGESLRVSDSLGLKIAVNWYEYLRIFCATGLKMMVSRWGCVGVIC